jgi:hypothetical protein
MNLILQPRDIQTLKFIFAFRAVTYDQLAKRHFQNVSASAMRRRIRILVKAGYLKTDVIVQFGKTIRVIQPQSKVWDILKSNWPFEIDKPHFKSESVEHDVRLTELFLKFESMTSFCSFMTENLLCSSKVLAADPVYTSASKIHSDGLLSISGAGGQFRNYAVELELNKKTKSRYTQKLIDYYLSGGLDGLLYVVPNMELQNLIAKVDAEVCEGRNSILYFAQEKNVKASNNQIIFQNRKGQILEIK